ncbi:MAG TPA: formate/nitrite transporter family protein [Chthoniobacterales bacterium]|jgi:formate/nitrite transporter FocA (FNT family)
MPNDRKTKKSKEEAESEEVQERTSPGGHIVYAAVFEEGMHELDRSNSALAWSGTAAGLAMGMSLLTEGVLHSRLPDAPWRPLIEKFGYSIGFLMVVLGRQQLFTENTLTVILPLLRKPRMRMFMNVARLWSIVLFCNLLGTFFVAWMMGNTNVVSPEVRHAMQEIGHNTMNQAFGSLVIRGIFAGFMIAIMVWLLPFAETGRVAVIIIITYVVGIAELAHVIVGSVDAFYMVGIGEKTMLDYFAYMGPVLLGNIIGGSSIVATVAHAQYVEEDKKA